MVQNREQGPLVWVKILGLWVSFVVGILLIKLGVNLYIFLCAFSLMAEICLFVMFKDIVK